MGEATKSGPAGLTAEAVTLSYPGQGAAAVVRADLTVRPGTVLAITGPSGCGKSSLLYCLGGVLRPSAGRVLLDGADLAGADDTALSAIRAGRFGFVFQFGELVPELTLAENVGLPLLIAGIGRRRARPRVAEMLGRLEIGALADRRPAQVSGGQAQRAAVARALIHQPSYVFADEPTGSLDRHSGALVLDAMLGIARDQGAGVVLITHDPDVAARADQVAAMADGVLAEPVRRSAESGGPGAGVTAARTGSGIVSAAATTATTADAADA